MLVLSRKKAEQIQIGDNITITVLRVKGSAVQIGIDAPNHVKILRSELSFDPPGTPLAAPLDTQPAPRHAPLQDDRHFQDARRSIVDLSGDPVTLADTLVFLG